MGQIGTVGARRAEWLALAIREDPVMRLIGI
jgi:hypothetical protein